MDGWWVGGLKEAMDGRGRMSEWVNTSLNA
jgi:hypothetical protein